MNRKPHRILIRVIALTLIIGLLWTSRLFLYRSGTTGAIQPTILTPILKNPPPKPFTAETPPKIPLKNDNLLSGRPFRLRPAAEESRIQQKAGPIIHVQKFAHELPTTNAQYPPPLEHPHVNFDQENVALFTEFKPGDRLSPGLWFLDPESLQIRPAVATWLRIDQVKYQNLQLLIRELWVRVDQHISQTGSAVQFADGRQALILPANTKLLGDLKMQFEASTIEILGENLGFVAQKLMEPQLLPLTGNFGAFPVLITFMTFDDGTTKSHSTTFETGKSAYLPFLGNLEFQTPEGMTKRSVQDGFLRAPDSLLTYKFTSSPPPMIRSSINFSR